jgi:branched-chain amino acid transport system ATP-binding protein
VGDPPLLEVRGVSKHFGGVQAVSGVDLAVGEREVLSVIGPNGAGKTTLINAVSGIYRADGGRILFAGGEI